jgi:hypothetical protein
VNLFALLVVAIAATHYGYDPLCALVPSLEHASKAVFYVLRGAEGTVLFVIIGILRPALWPVCIWGAVEEGETAVCRIAIGSVTPPAASPWSGLCGDYTQLPLYMLGVVYLAILATRKAKNEPRT